MSIRLHPIQLLVDVAQRAMQVLVLEHKLLAFLHILRPEKVVELLFQTQHYLLDPVLYLHAALFVSVFYFLLQREHLRHEFVVVDLF